MAKNTDAVLEAAQGLALDALKEVTADKLIGPHLGVKLEGERLLTHYFRCENPGYVGWRWAVTLTRVPRGRQATVCEVELLPGEEAILAPAWVPWSDRLRPEDVTRRDVLPYQLDDDRLEQGYEAVDTHTLGEEEEADKQFIYELGLGRKRVLSEEGRALAAKRWMRGESGPVRSAMRRGTTCSSCGFMIKLAGSMRRVFGVCANEWSPDDGRVVALDHSCGAHSETDEPHRGQQWPVTPVRLNEGDVEVLSTEDFEETKDPKEEPATEVAEAPEESTEAVEAEAEEAFADTEEPPAVEAEETQPEASEETLEEASAEDASEK